MFFIFLYDKTVNNKAVQVQNRFHRICSQDRFNFS